MPGRMSEPTTQAPGVITVAGVVGGVYVLKVPQSASKLNAKSVELMSTIAGPANGWKSFAMISSNVPPSPLRRSQ